MAMETNHNASIPRLAWVNLVRILALVWIFANHLSERVFGFPYLANPSQSWPPFDERLTQLMPIAGSGLQGIGANLFRYIGWIGDQGVQLFLIVSGFGLTWSILHRVKKDNISIVDFYRRRLIRIYPSWLGAHLFFIFLWFFAGWGLSPTRVETYFSMLGLRMTPELLYYFSPAWWFIGLLLQLYIVYPFLLRIAKRIGPGKFLLAAMGLGFAVRAGGFFILEGWLDAWNRGAIFLTRLPEFAFGMALAYWVYQSPRKVSKLGQNKLSWAILLCGYILGLMASLTLWGMVFAPFLTGICAFLLLFLASNRIDEKFLNGKIIRWFALYSFSIYLYHQSFILLFIPQDGDYSIRLGQRIAIVVIVTLLVSWAMERTVQLSLKWSQRWKESYGYVGLVRRFVLFAAMSLGILLAAEYAVRLFTPQEVLGWGERPALQSHAAFGWNLQPSQVTRLRWESYDYEVSANSLGFPGPSYSVEKTSDIYRIITIGDAFTSAEGVDTQYAWPRLLEDYLGKHYPSNHMQVMNFGITGYGPDQYVKVLETYVPTYNPDLVIVGFYVNEYADVLWTTEQFQENIGFHLPSSNSWKSYLRLDHLRQFLRTHLAERVIERVRRVPNPQGYFIGGFYALEKANYTEGNEGVLRVETRLREIKAITDRNGADLLLVLIPAPIQVCAADQLDYFPAYTRLSDSSIYDVDEPQNTTLEIVASLHIQAFDLRRAFGDAPSDCPYFKNNMHFNEMGHRIVASYITEHLTLPSSDITTPFARVFVWDGKDQRIISEQNGVAGE